MLYVVIKVFITENFLEPDNLFMVEKDKNQKSRGAKTRENMSRVADYKNII